MLIQCAFKGTTPLYFCNGCELFLETCCFVVGNDGLTIGGECEKYLCSDCSEICVYKGYINQ